MTIAAFLLAFIKAIPSIEKIFSDVQMLYFQQQEAADINRTDKRKAERDAFIAAMLRPGVTDAELKDLRRALFTLNRS